MLADILETKREPILRDVEPTLSEDAPFGLCTAARHARLNTLLDELVGALRRGSVDEQLRSTSIADESAQEHDERELLQRYIIQQIGLRSLDASPDEMQVVGAWTAAADRDRFREQATRLAALLDRVDEIAAILSPEGNFRYLNGRGLRVLHDSLGLAPHEVIGKTGGELHLPPELKINSPPELVALARNNASYEAEVLGRVKEARVSALYGADGAVTAVELVGSDIHDRKLSRARLDVLARLSMLVGSVTYDQVPEALARVPIPELADWCSVTLVEDGEIRDTHVVQRDPGKAALRDRVMRIACSWGRHPLWSEKLTGGFQLLAEVTDDLMRKLAGNDADYRTLRQVGVRSLMVLPLVSRMQLAGIMTLVFTDESGRRYSRDHPALAEELAFHAAHIIENARLMQQIKSSEARFRVALASARTLVYEQDRDLRYTWSYNPVVPINLAGKSQEDSIAADEARVLKQLKRRVIERGEGVQERMNLTVAGRRRHFREAIEPLRDYAGKIIGVIGAATDISEEQRAQEELREAIGFRERLMGILGHDLRNPLNAVSMAADQLLRRKDLPADACDQASRIGRSARRMDEMIATLLDLTRLRMQGKLPLSPAPADMSDIARDAIDELRATAPNRSIELELRGDPRGHWDRARIEQLTSNLVANALSYGDPARPVHVLIDGTGEELVLAVGNEGPPIPAELIPVLFEPFRRGVPEDRSPRGLGLGLYIANQIALAHGGTIGVESTAQSGTTFIVHLPRAHTPDA